VFNPTWLFVGVVYAVAVFLARRANADLPVRTAVLFYALVLIFMFAPMTGPYVNVPVDFLKTLEPWSYIASHLHFPRAENAFMNDVVLQITPWAHHVRESWKSLQPPLWNELSGAGYPLLGNPQSSALSPLRILALPLSLGHAMTAEAAMKLLIALTFTFLFCRRRGYSELASCAGAIAFGFSMFLVVWLHFPLATSACFVPAVLHATDLIAERVTYARFVLLAVLWAALLFGGHPETAAHTFFLCALYVLWIAVAERRAKFIAAMLGAMAIAGLLTAPLLGPFAESLTKSKRFAQVTSHETNGVVPFSDWPSAVALLQPRIFGDIPHEDPFGPAHPESITGFAGILGLAAWFALSINVIATRSWRSRELFFVVATLIMAGVIFDWPVIGDVFHFVFRLAANGRVRLLFALLLAIQTAAIIDLIERGRRVPVLTGIACAAAIHLVILYAVPFMNAYQFDTAMLAMLPSVAVLALAVVAVYWRPALMLVIVAIVAETWSSGREWNPVIDDKWMYPRTKLLEKLDELHAQAPANEPLRVVALGPMFFPNLSEVFGYQDVRPHDPMANAKYIDLLAQLVKEYDPNEYFARWNDAETQFLDYMNIRYVIAARGLPLDPSRYTLVYDGEDGRIFENRHVLPRFFAVPNVIIIFNDEAHARTLRNHPDWSQTGILETLELETQQMHDDFFLARPANAPKASLQILEAGGDDYRLHVKAPRYTLVVSSIPWWPGWKVTRSGTRIDPIKVNGGFLGFAVPAGESEVRVWYDPWTFRYGTIIALATIIGLIACRNVLVNRSRETSP
jgi:Bacterial membrane protein YfhO